MRFVAGTFPGAVTEVQLVVIWGAGSVLLPSAYAKLLLYTAIVILKFHRDDVMTMGIRQFTVFSLKFSCLLFLFMDRVLLYILMLINISLYYITLDSQFMVPFLSYDHS